MSVHSSIGPARRRTLTPYVLLYLLAASLAGAYLVFLGIRPDIVAMLRNKPDETKAALIETQTKVERAVAEIDPLKQGVGEVKEEVASIKVGMQEGAERDRILLEKVETLERAAAVPAEKVAATPAQPKKQVAAAPAKPADPAHKAPAAAPKQAAAPQKQASASPVPGIETGSIEQQKAAAPVKPAQVGVLLATGPSLDALRLSWTILNDRNADAIRSLHARYVVSGSGSDRTYGLIAGPLETIADAKAVCKTISDRGMPCEVSQFRGSAF